MATQNLSLQISSFVNEKDNAPKLHEAAWSELCDEAITSAHKAGVLCWSPATFNGPRAKKNVVSVACLVFDLDSELTTQLIERLSKLNYIVHSTFTPGRWRVILQTSRPHSPSEHKPLWQAVAKQLGGDFDKACTDESRLYYWATKHPDRPFEKYENFEGLPIDVDRTLAEAGPLEARPTAPPSPPPEIFEPGEIDLDKYRAQVKASNIRPDRKDLALKMLGGKWGPATGGRDNAIMDAVGGLFTVAEPLPPQHVCEFLCEGVLAHMQTEPEGREEWRKIFMRMCERNREHQVRYRAAKASERKALDDAFEAQGIARGEEPDWRKNFQGQRDEETGVVKPAPTGFNLFLILQHDARFKTLRFNLVNRKVECTEGPLAGVPYDVIETRLANWLSAEYKLKISRPECKAQIDSFLVTRQYDPLKDYLNGIEAWDGVERITNLLRDKCGATQQSEFYTQGVSRKFFISAVARGLSPGTQVDTMLILQGEGGIGKTSFIRSLGGPFVSEMTLNIHDKDALMAITGNWLVEQAEMSTMKKADIEGFRAFVTRKTDTFRPPYGRVLEEFPRRCVFVGTTNSDQPLKDVEGQRRYWPVRCKEIDWKWIAKNRSQLWAEAVEAYKAGEEYYFSREEQPLVDKEIGIFQESEPAADAIVEWFLGMARDKRPTEVTTHLILRDCISLTGAALLDRRNEIAVGKALRALGFEKFRSGAGARPNLHKTPQELLTGMQKRRGGPTLSAVPKETEPGETNHGE